jgi:acetyl esterase/lipase
MSQPIRPGRSRLEYLRLAIATLLFALGLLVVVPAQNLVMWIMTVGVTEWGQWLVLVALVLLAWELWCACGKCRFITSFLCVLAIGLFVLPFMEAISISHELPGGLKQAFGPRPTDSGVPPGPLRWTRLWGSFQRSDVKQQSLQYPGGDGTPLALDFYSNGTPGERPCIIVVHGGSWHTGNEKELGAWDPRLASLNYRVASIAYRLAPQSRWPAQKEDLVAALKYLKAHAVDLGVDPNQFILLGRSAGAQIILATAYGIHDPSIRGCIACYPPTDMNFDYGTGTTHSILDGHHVISQFLGGKPDEVPENYRDASPMDLVGPETPPTLLAQGTRDEIVWIENSRRLRERLIEGRRPVYLLEMPWATHGFDANPSGPGGQLEFFAMTWFMGSVLTPSSK